MMCQIYSSSTDTWVWVGVSHIVVRRDDILMIMNLLSETGAQTINGHISQEWLILKLHDPQSAACWDELLYSNAIPSHHSDVCGRFTAFLWNRYLVPRSGLVFAKTA